MGGKPTEDDGEQGAGVEWLSAQRGKGTRDDGEGGMHEETKCDRGGCRSQGA